ncbi:MAG: gamma subclass chorismate mutase AroQ [Betaproteobacteria bacterium]|nr:gamma subclass chorismate mutase AroQ [Betaproteobacteria bacterium]
MPNFRSLLILLASLILHLPAAAQTNRLDEIIARGVLRVGTTGDYKPFSYRTNPASPFIGLDIELAGQLAKALGVRLELAPTSWPNLMKDLGEDRFDIAMSGVSISLERQKKALYSIPYLRDGKTPITRCENQARFQTLAQIDQPGVRLIVNPGGTNERFARAHIKQAGITVYPDNTTIFDQIVAGKADLMITDAIETRLQQKLKPQLCAVHPDAPFDFSEKAYLLPRDLLWKDFVDQWLHQTIESGALTRLQDKWLTYPWPQSAPEAINLEPLRRLMDERLALMSDVARYKWNTQSPIEDLPREQKIIDGLKAEALALGVPAAWAEKFFRAQIEAAKIIQREHFARWQQAHAGPFADAPDLATVIRPRLDALTPQLLRALAAAWPALASPAQHARIAAYMQGMQTVAVSAPAAALAAAPLIDGSASMGTP